MKMTRYQFAAGLLVSMICFAQQGSSDPWTPKELLDPAAFAAQMQKGQKPAKVIAVAFPILYKQRHIPGAVYAGPGNKDEGIAALKKEVAGVPKDAEIVLYCGCCPMDRCPNIRPAFAALKAMGYTKVRALNIPTNMHTDWYTKKYPAEPPVTE